MVQAFLLHSTFAAPAYLVTTKGLDIQEFSELELVVSHPNLSMCYQTRELYLQGELDELEREEFFRLKKVQAKKKRDAAEKDQAVVQV